MKSNIKYFECGQCGYYHRIDYYGDCRNDDERFDTDYIEKVDPDFTHVLSLEEQIENE